MNRLALVIATTAIFGVTSFVTAQSSTSKPLPAGPTLDCAVLPCAALLPHASRFEVQPGTFYAVGLDADGKTVGWVARSTDIVDVPAYSGKPLVTLVALDPVGTIMGVRVIAHSEPILLVGIPEHSLHEFSARYVGHPATAHIVVGKSDDRGALSVDIISGATVTALALNKTILDTARSLGTTVGVVASQVGAGGHFVQGRDRWSWQRMLEEHVLGRLVVTEKDMNLPGPSGDFVDLYFTLADAPQIGRSLFGDELYENLMKALKPGEHLVVILGNGSGSFKGSGFVRGGIFDRVRIEQGLVELIFRDHDYRPLSEVKAAGAPSFKEGGVFISRGASLDPGRPFDLVFLGSRYTGQGFEREFKGFKGTLELPASVFVSDRPISEAIYVQAWRNQRTKVIALVLYLMFVVGVFVARRYTVREMKRIQRLHLLSMLIGLVGVGIILKTQPSVTQVLTFIGFVVHGGHWDLFAAEPLLFVFWIFIFVGSLIWGRGIFCGWVCPYGALSELLHKIATRLRVPTLELPDAIHRKARYLRYVVLGVLVLSFLYSSVLGEELAEIEPFKSTFYVPAWTRHWGFFLWWALLLGLAFMSWRPFCRYLCPLGAGLAVLSSFRFAGPHRRRFCSHCTICTRGCEPRAIDAQGVIDSRECLSCLECEANYNDPKTCPPVVGIELLKQKKDRTAHDDERLAQLEREL